MSDLSCIFTLTYLPCFISSLPCFVSIFPTDPYIYNHFDNVFTAIILNSALLKKVSRKQCSHGHTEHAQQYILR